MKTTQPLKPGDQFHFLASGVLFATSTSFSGANEVSRRGATVTVTEALIEASKDRHGRDSWLDLVDDQEGQRARFSKVVFSRGPAPAGLSPWTPDSPEQQEAHDLARAAAYAIPEGSDRRAALAEVVAVFGRPSTSRTIRVETEVS
jgi:hypothetical protein